MRTVTATRYVTPLREGGSLPAVVEADDDGLYVLKFRGAGQGPKALIAELVGGEIARAAGLDVPEIVLIELDPELARTEPDAEIQDLIRASAGLNLGLDFLPGSVTFDPLAHPPAGELASAIVWLDAFISNVDRTARNTNMLVWHRRLWLIDHGAALYFHHQWDGARERARSPFPMVKDHVLLPRADALAAADRVLAQRITPALIRQVVDRVPDAWLCDEPAFADAAAHRAAYVEVLSDRLQAPRTFLEEALRAQAAHL
ncbi:MAG TPA: HipA family kinase [Albitalea sp.]|uniref:HipA family kinase n=1 Tax=Piscinibacter sp. TaxID=1903157 RepID=UPI002ED4E536